MTPAQKTNIVCGTCIVLIFLGLGYSLFCIVMGQWNRVMVGPSLFLLIGRFNLWYLRRQNSQSQSQGEDAT